MALFTRKTQFYSLSLIIIYSAAVWSCNLIFKQQSKQSTLTITSQINKANASILQIRKHILALHQQFKAHKQISSPDINWLHYLWEDRPAFNPYSKQDWLRLRKAYDIVPAKFIISQAEKLSQNGHSLPAQRGNNIFNTVTNKAEVGIASLPVTPEIKRRNWLTPNELQYTSYATLSDAILNYILILNSNPGYEKFRNQRYYRRLHKLPINHWPVNFSVNTVNNATINPKTTIRDTGAATLFGD